MYHYCPKPGLIHERRHTEVTFGLARSFPVNASKQIYGKINFSIHLMKKMTIKLILTEEPIVKNTPPLKLQLFAHLAKKHISKQLTSNVYLHLK